MMVVQGVLMEFFGRRWVEGVVVGWSRVGQRSRLTHTQNLVNNVDFQTIMLSHLISIWLKTDLNFCRYPSAF